MTAWLRSDQQTFLFLFATASGPLAEGRPFSKRLHVSNIFQSRASNTSLIAQAMGDIRYFYEKDFMGAAIVVRYSKRSEFLFASV